MPNAIGFDIYRQIRTKTTEHPLAMVAGRHRLDHFGNASDVQPREQDSAFHLRGGDRQSVADRYGGDQPTHHQRQQPAGACCKLGAHLAERINHAAHRAFGQAGIANEGRG